MTHSTGMAVAINADCCFQRAELFSWRISSHLWLARHSCAGSDIVLCISTSCTLGEVAFCCLFFRRALLDTTVTVIVHRFHYLVQYVLFDTPLLPKHRGSDFAYVLKPRTTLLHVIVHRSGSKNVDMFGAQRCSQTQLNNEGIE